MVLNSAELNLLKQLNERYKTFIKMQLPQQEFL
jgi:hypothetical protein